MTSWFFSFVYVRDGQKGVGNAFLDIPSLSSMDKELLEYVKDTIIQDQKATQCPFDLVIVYFICCGRPVHLV